MAEVAEMEREAESAQVIPPPSPKLKILRMGVEPRGPDFREPLNVEVRLRVSEPLSDVGSLVQIVVDVAGTRKIVDVGALTPAQDFQPGEYVFRRTVEAADAHVVPQHLVDNVGLLSVRFFAEAAAAAKAADEIQVLAQASVVMQVVREKDGTRHRLVYN